MTLRFFKHLAFRYYVAFLVGFIVLSLYLLYYWYRPPESELREFNLVLQSEVKLNTRSLKAEHLLQEIKKSNGFLAATRTENENKILSFGYRVCVVDPALTDCQTMGFAALLLRTMDDIILCEALGSDRPVVYWRACKSVCSRDPRVNSWEWYFESIHIGSGLLESQVQRVLCPLMIENEESVLRTYPDLKSILNSSFRNRSYAVGFANSRIITEKERRRVNQMLQQYVKPNSRIIRKLNNFYHRYLAGNTVLGVHVRGTDHWMETNENRLPHLMSWVESAQSILKTLPQPSKIFIASDNDEVIEKFVAFFGNDKVVFTKAFRASKYDSPLAPHDFQFADNPADPYERVIGTQVLLDILLLAKCDHFLHAESSVASLASYFNPAMKSYFLDEKQVKGRQRKLRKKSRINNEREPKLKTTEKSLQTIENKPDEFRDLMESIECFQRNSPTSACPNAAKGKFVNLTEARDFFKPYS